jgi:hypothetical protein
MSSPMRPTFLPGDTASSAAIVRPCGSASTNSAGSTASAPRGTGAPVITRTACPADTVPSKGRPGIESPITASGSRL